MLIKDWTASVRLGVVREVRSSKVDAPPDDGSDKGVGDESSRRTSVGDGLSTTEEKSNTKGTSCV